MARASRILRAAERDVAAFERLVKSRARAFFDGFGDIHIARAPGRIDVMGGIADYSGSVVLEGTIAEAAVVGVQRRRERAIRIWSYGLEREHEGWESLFTIPLKGFFTDGQPQSLKSYEDVHRMLKSDPSTAWAGYPLGVLFVLLSERVLASLPFGFNVLLHSNVPIGAGVSSSAAIEVATMKALDAALGLNLDALELARLCQIAENRVVGAPCGIMDQVTCALCEADKLLSLRCQPHDVLGLHALPQGCRVVGINSNVKHAVGGRRYTKARVSAFMGLKLITKAKRGDNFGGYLCNISPHEFRRRFWKRLPTYLRGSEFLKRYGETDDPVTRVDPKETYSVRGCTEHPIYENHRVQRFISLIERAHAQEDERALIQAGRLMYASHWSYSYRCGLGAKEIDLLVALAKAYGVKHGIYGAKITGGGSGGTVALLIREDAEAMEVVRQIARIYEERTGLSPQIFDGTSPGAFPFGVRRIRF